MAPDSAGLSPPRVTVSLDDGHALGRAPSRDRRTPRAAACSSSAGRRSRPRRTSARFFSWPTGRRSAWRDQRLVPFSPDVVTHVGWRRSPDGSRARVGPRRRRAGATRGGERLAADRVAAVLRRIAELRSTDAGRCRRRGAGAMDCAARTVRRGGETDARAVAGGHAGRRCGRALAAADAPDRRLLPVPVERVRRVSLVDGEHRLVLLRDGAGQPWRFGPPDDQTEVDQPAVAEWLARLAATNVTAPARTGRRIIVGDHPDDGRHRRARGSRLRAAGARPAALSLTQGARLRPLRRARGQARGRRRHLRRSQRRRRDVDQRAGSRARSTA